MLDWLSYRPTDFLLFSPRTYWRLFELENAALWPLPLATLLIGLALPALLLRRRPATDRAAALLLAAAWAWVGWSFLWQRYAPVNWAAAYLAPLFGLQALLFVWLAVRGDGIRLRQGLDPQAAAGFALIGYALLLHPLTAPLAGRPLAGAEIVGIAPDPTAILTLGIALLQPPGSARRLLFLVPSLWLAASAATLLTLAAPEGWISAATLALAAILGFLDLWRARADRSRLSPQNETARDGDQRHAGDGRGIG
ncbi:DUF6064 family protein [Algihabitans albus]|uniref:DUF6064 family protein n=1 Tax=Algihabitans albus TaxID=2164067 RepID=UPI001F399D3B|nr:DUF6064 family protein [Algihabitans albus]